MVSGAITPSPIPQFDPSAQLPRPDPWPISVLGKIADAWPWADKTLAQLQRTEAAGLASIALAQASERGTLAALAAARDQPPRSNAAGEVGGQASRIDFEPQTSVVTNI